MSFYERAASDADAIINALVGGGADAIDAAFDIAESAMVNLGEASDSDGDDDDDELGAEVRKAVRAVEKGIDLSVAQPSDDESEEDAPCYEPDDELLVPDDDDESSGVEEYSELVGARELLRMHVFAYATRHVADDASLRLSRVPAFDFIAWQQAQVRAHANTINGAGFALYGEYANRYVASVQSRVERLIREKSLVRRAADLLRPLRRSPVTLSRRVDANRAFVYVVDEALPVLVRFERLNDELPVVLALSRLVDVHRMAADFVASEFVQVFPFDLISAAEMFVNDRKVLKSEFIGELEALIKILTDSS